MMVKIMKIFLFSSTGFLSVQLAFLGTSHSQLFVEYFVQPVWISRTNGVPYELILQFLFLYHHVELMEIKSSYIEAEKNEGGYSINGL